MNQMKSLPKTKSLPKPKPSSARSVRTGVATGRLEDACKDWAQNQVMEEKFVVEGIGKTNVFDTILWNANFWKHMDQHNLLCWINWDKRMFLPQLYITKPGLPINCCPPTQPVFNSTKRGIQVAMPFRTVALHAMIQILREETMPRFHMYELGGSIYRIMGITWTSKFQTWIYFLQQSEHIALLNRKMYVVKLMWGTANPYC